MVEIKCNKCKAKIAINENYYYDGYNVFCTKCTESKYTTDQILMSFVGLDIQEEKDIQIFYDIAQKYPNRHVKGSDDAFDFGMELMLLPTGDREPSLFLYKNYSSVL